ncbi:MAG: hypothetical protein WC824_12415 [Bacteroidota bacterium]|jgi:hypothetical protein
MTVESEIPIPVNSRKTLRIVKAVLIGFSVVALLTTLILVAFTVRVVTWYGLDCKALCLPDENYQVIGGIFEKVSCQCTSIRILPLEKEEP